LRNLVKTPKFSRAFRKFTKRNYQLEARVEETLRQMQEDVFAESLGTHKLSGNLEGIIACSCGYDCRILFIIEVDGEGESIVLLDVGKHDDVY
jgi:mRNA-degrading endonuclease YafQ of YafQ-DinJ toxin-antitoxin module